MIFEDEQRRRGRAAGLRAPSRRLRLRDRLVPGGPAAGHVRPPPARHRPLPDRREDQRLPRPARRSTTTARSIAPTCRPRPPGRPRALAVRLHVGQPRVLLEGVAEPAELRRRPRPAQTRKVAANQAWFEYQPARVVDPAGRPTRPLRAARRRRRAAPRVRRSRPGPRAGQPRRDRQPEDLPHSALGRAMSS